jgi:acyl transferase domain-containing protein/NADPH:quinone reductase-like Zn-dependent oxidoreductase/acyl carrier protein
MPARDAAPDPEHLVAIVGMAGRFPGAADLDGLWQLLMARRDAIRPVPAERWDASAELDPECLVPGVGGFIDGVELFDPTFFGISPREAEDIDPQQRLMLEQTWQALENAGQPAAALRGSRTGVYVGASWHDYEILRAQRGTLATQHSGPGNALDVIAARVSYVLGLRGPSLTVETGCSSSLVALHLACQALRSGEIDGALVGGVNLILAPDMSIALTRLGALSPDGRCHAFAASANGFVRGEGVVAVYLKPLARALADGDRIRGVIVGSAVNNDGGGDSLVTPSPSGQDDLLARAYADARISANDIAYVEAHGTGTAVGDPIEAGAIGRVLGQRRDPACGPLAIGSIKTNIGHLEAAAGLAGLVKIVLALEHRVVPPSLYTSAPNPAIAFEALGLQVVGEPLALPATGAVHAGVNSFGWGGTNAHAVVRSAPPAPSIHAAASLAIPVVVAVSAHCDEALRRRASDLAVVAASGVAVEDLAATLAHRRDAHPRRAAFVAASVTELAEQLAGFAADPANDRAGVVSGTARRRGRIAFVFPGQGGQWPAMGRALFAASPSFATAIRRCAAALAPHVDWDLATCVAGEAGAAWSTRVDMLQPVMWAISVALAELWRELGIEPDVVIGHSQGEIAAATVAGVLSLDDAAQVVARRSALIRRIAGRGAMLAVELDPDAARAALAGFEDRVALAVHNGPSSCVLSGDADAIAVLHELLEADGTPCRPVQVDYASHSHHIDAFAGELTAALHGIAPGPARIAVMSSVLAAPLSGPDMDAAYWLRNLRAPVRFAEAMARVLDDGASHVIEVSPHPLLVPAIEQLAALRREPVAVLGTLRRGAGTPADFALAAARAFVAGLAPFAQLPRSVQVALPAYPWQRKAYWPAPGKRRAARGGFELALVPAPDAPDAWQGAIDLARDDHPWLADHRVHGATLLPATAMLALALTAARDRGGSLPAALCDVRFRRELALGDEPARIGVVWRDDVAGGRVALLSLAPGARTWTEHATARIAAIGDGAAPAVAFPAALAGAPALDADAFYAACDARGLHYGPAFRGVVQIFAGGAAALGELRLPEACRAGLRSHALHPALWDAALQVCLALCPGERTVVPTAIARVALLDELAAPSALWAHAVRCDVARFDVVVFDADRRAVIALDGVTLEPLAEIAGPGDTDRLHRLELHDAPRATVTPGGGAWQVCGAPPEARALVDAIGAGATRLVAPCGGDPEPAPAAWLAAIRATGEPDGILFAAPRAAAGLSAQRSGLAALTGLVQACTMLATPPRLVVVTADAQAARPDDRPDPGAALYAGFARVVRREHPELRPLVIDVATADPGWAATCAAELAAGDGEDEIALRPGHRLVARLVRGARAAGDAPAAPAAGPRQPFRLHAARPGVDGLEFRPLYRRRPSPGEIEVEVTTAALNFLDAMKVMGTYPGDEAARLGGECAGRIVAIGAGVTGLAAGDRVVACGFGSFASHITVRADHAQRIPDAMTDTDAAGLSLAATTACYALHELARLAPGESLLIHSAAGGLGLAAIQVARQLGARVLATAGSEDKRRRLRALGIADVFDSRDAGWLAGVRSATGGRGVDVVLNSLTGVAIAHGLDALAEDGRFIEVGKQDIHADRALRLGAFRKAISFAAVDLAGLLERRPVRFARALAAAWDQIRAGAIAPLPTTQYRFADAADALAEMMRGRHTGKLVLTAPETVCAVVPEPLPGGRFRSDASYLITGGLGALGLSLAAFLAEQGAGALALAGRSAPCPAAASAVAALRARGVQVEVLALDVSDAEAVGRALDWVRRTMPALRGVIHAAGVLEDATLAHLEAGQLARVLAPKLDGARHLDAATAGDPLDLFVMFSSAAALVGNAGQAAYAAANAYLDALAIARRRRGLPGLSVQWGPFDDIGLAAQDRLRGARLAEHGMTGIAAADAWRALTRLLVGDEPVVGYLALDPRRWFDAYPDTAAQPSWQRLRDTQRRGPAGDAAFRNQLEACPAPLRRTLVETKVRDLASRVLRLDPAEIDHDTPFKALGLDSLLRLELRNRLEAAFGLALPPTLLWTHGNPRALAGALCERVAGTPLDS